MIGVLALAFGPKRFFDVRDGRSGESYFLRRATRSSRVVIEWIHSIEHTPWIEEYELVDGQFALRKVNLKSFGSGVDQVAPEVITRDGWVTMRGMKRRFEALTFFHSPGVNRRVTIDGRELELDERVPEDATVEIRARVAPRALTWLIRP